MDYTLILKKYSRGEEIANCITHGIAILISIAALSVLVAFASLYGNAWHVVSCSIFGASMIILYSVSTIYHSLPVSKAKAILRIFDHSMIFILIAGTYTPFTLVTLRGTTGWILFGAVWGFTLFGILFQSCLIRKSIIYSLILYIGMGWSVIVAIKPLYENISSGGLLLIFLGGLTYTSGVFFYVFKKLKYHHAIWHLFVLSGSLLHFFAILFYVIPLAESLNY